MKNGIIGIVGIVYLFTIGLFLHNYFHHSPTDEPWYRSASIPDLLFSLDELTQGKQNVVMTAEGNNGIIFYLFYHRVDPKTFQNQGSPRQKDSLAYNNFVYRNSPCPLGDDTEKPVYLDANTLYVNHFSCKIPSNTDIVKTIYHPDGSGAYRILRIVPIPTSL